MSTFGDELKEFAKSRPINLQLNTHFKIDDIQSLFKWTFLSRFEHLDYKKKAAFPKDKAYLLISDITELKAGKDQ